MKKMISVDNGIKFFIVPISLGLFSVFAIICFVIVMIYEIISFFGGSDAQKNT